MTFARIVYVAVDDDRFVGLVVVGVKRCLWTLKDRDVALVARKIEASHSLGSQHGLSCNRFVVVDAERIGAAHALFLEAEPTVPCGSTIPFVAGSTSSA